METKSTVRTNEKEGSLERKGRFLEIMELRHRNAFAVLQIERILSQEETSTDYPSTRTSENIRIKKEALDALEPILASLSSAGLLKKNEVAKEAINRYFFKKIEAQRVEMELKEQLKKSGKEVASLEMGRELFRQRTNEESNGSVEAVRQEGYFILAFYNDEDYFKFKGIKKDESGGSFHRAERFPGMTVDVILSRDGFNEIIALHERQHFINGSIFQNFTGIENLKETKILEGFVWVKDELLARFRDGSDSEKATTFFDDELYKYLSDMFSSDERLEVRTLLKEVQSELRTAFGIFDQPQARGILVYHLIDVPFVKFPESIKAIVEFYKTKTAEFTKFIPDDLFEQKRLNDALMDLRQEIISEADWAADLIAGKTELSYLESQKELKETKERIKKLRKNYDELFTK